MARPGHKRARTLGIAVLAAAALTAPGLTAAHAATFPQPAQASTKSAAANTAASSLTPTQALARAKASGKPVPIDAATTPTQVLTANPNGTLSLTQSIEPVRARVHGTWQNLDATLIKNPDGTLSPKVSTGPVSLSGGGNGPLATMTAGTRSLALSLPMALPAPTLSGATATYTNVLPGVDLESTVTAQGGFSEVLVVKNAAAAANPALKLLTFSASGRGLNLSADGKGGVAAKTTKGQVLFTAPKPTMWDSTSSTAVVPSALNPATGIRVDARSGNRLNSDATGPGSKARTAAISFTVGASALILTPDDKLLAGTPTYPLYIDPTWTPAGSTASSWTYTSSVWPNQSYWKTSDALKVGYDGWSTGQVAESFYTMTVPSAIYGATVHQATAYFPEVWSPSCSARAVQLWQTGTISSGTTWNSPPSFISQLGSDNVAYGYSSSCQAADVAYDITGTMASAASGRWANVTLGLKAADEGDKYAWKQFSHTATITTQYDTAPAKPTTLTTSPATACTGSTVGNGTVALNAVVTDKEGGSLSATFSTYANNNTADTYAHNASFTVSATSGTTATLLLSQADLEAADTRWGVNQQVPISWNVIVSDGLLTSPVSTTCTFTFSTAIPGQPQITDASNNQGCGTLSYQVGTAAGFTFKPNSSTTPSTTPTGYTYQLNAGPPITVAANGGSASINITPNRHTNVLSVNAIAAGSNIGQSAQCVITAISPANAADQDLNGDGIPDLLTVSTGAGLPGGLWLADGQSGTSGRGNGKVQTAAADLAPAGPQGAGTATDWNGLKAISGRFSDAGFNDVLAYLPDGQNAYLLDGSGDGSTDTVDVHDFTGIYTDSSTGDFPMSLASAYDTSANGSAYPDIIATNGDASNGYYLAYYANSGGPSAYDGANQQGAPYQLTNPTPGSTTDKSWNNWTITTGQDTRGGATYTDMYLWNKTSGALYLWELTGLSNQYAGASGSFDPDTGTFTPPTPPTATLAYTQYELSSSWNAGAAFTTLQASDIGGNPALWTVTPAGAVQSYTFTNLSTTASSATVTATYGTAPLLGTATHTWPLNDGTNDSSGNPTAADTTGAVNASALNLTSASGTTWYHGDQFDPDIQLNGTSGRLTTSAPAVDLTSSFTVSAWVDPTAIGGSVLAQWGSADVGLTLFAGSNGWVFSLNTGNGTANSYDTISGGTVQLGAWSHLTAAYDVSDHVMSLYVDDVYVAYGSHAAPSAGATGDFVIGYDGSRHFNGQISQVQVWKGSAVAPAQPYTPGAYHQALTPTRILDTRGSNIGGYSSNPPSTPVPAFGTVALQIVGDSVKTPNGTATTIPNTATAVSVDVTVTVPTQSGVIATYPDGTQRPQTSSSNFTANTGVTGYQIVPIGPDGKIALYNNSTGTTHLIVDVTGYFTTDSTIAGNQTYHPLDPAQRALATANSIANTTGLSAVGKVPANTTFTLQITGNTGVPANATAVAANLTTYSQSGNGYLAAYPTGATVGPLTNLTYQTTDMAQMSADIPIGTGGKISIYNYGSATDIIIDIAGYYTNDTTGQLYHTTAPTRLVDTRYGIGGTTGAIPSSGSYAVTQATVARITNAGNATPALILTVTDTTSAGNIVAYGTTKPGTTNVNWTNAGSTVANLGLPPLSSSGTVNIGTQGSGSIDLVVDCSGYFAGS